MGNKSKTYKQEITKEIGEPDSDWVKNAIDKATQITVASHEEDLAKILIEKAFQTHKIVGIDFGIALAAAFDLFVAAEYYKSVTNTGWFYCPEGEPHLFFPFTNVCPRCVVTGKFRFESANKPESGQIGQSTSRLLAIFLYQLFKRSSRTLIIYRGIEPVDMIIYDRQNNIVLLAEVKAAPLTTLALATVSEALQESIDGNLVFVSEHKPSTVPVLHTAELFLSLPIVEEDKTAIKLFSLGVRGTQDSLTWAYKRITDIVSTTQSFFEDYIKFWLVAYKSYETRNEDKSNFYWLTNACGHPTPIPSGWKMRGGRNSGYESVSDGKTSVGMDRTDDIKKGIYQVLKIGAESKPRPSQFEVRTALISNIHAVRHYPEYLTALDDVVWTLSKDKKVKKAEDLPPDAAIYNLFDGIISFTESHIRDEWISKNFQF
ncbi:hypothetical protein [Candidatus Chlorohelix sp.]|uniref:hypothetical protein n=1 Tax=Candidatus Chlorohelix sp. TaxID=3139201 RepID=UPI00306644DB